MTEYRCKRDQVRRCCHRCRMYADISFLQTFPDAHERGIPIRQATPERGSLSPPPPGHHRPPTLPAAQAHHRSHSRLPRHGFYQNNCPRATLPREAHTCVGTRQARIVVGRCCRAGLVILGRITRRCIALLRTALRSSRRSIANVYARCRFQGLIRAGSLGFCGRRRRIGLTIDAEWRR